MLAAVKSAWRAIAASLGDHEDVVTRESIVDDEDRGWRRLQSADRDISQGDREDAIRQADDAWRRNPMAFRVTELTCEMVLGRGMRLTSEDPATQAFVDEWWSHWQNRMVERQYRLFRELFLTGELFMALFKNPFDGMTYVRAVPSGNIDTVETDPEDIEHEVRFHQVATGGNDDRWWGEEEMAHYCLYRLEGATRGLAPIAPLLVWIKRYRDWLQTRVRVNELKGSFVWGVSVPWSDRQAILRRQQELSRAPNPGSVLVHGADEEWTALSANIDAPEAAADGKALRRLIGMGAGFPLHYLSEADDSNRATAAEQELPVALHVQRLQASFGFMVADLARRCAERSGRFADGAVGAIEPAFGELNAADNLTVAQAGKTAAEALSVAVDRGWVDQDEAARLFRRVMGELTDSVAAGK